MVVVLANSLPDAIRGLLKLWFVEIKPYVFVSGIKDKTAEKVVNQLILECPIESGMVVFFSTSVAPFYSVKTIGNTNKELLDFDGLVLFNENPRN